MKVMPKVFLVVVFMVGANGAFAKSYDVSTLNALLDDDCYVLFL